MKRWLFLAYDWVSRAAILLVFSVGVTMLLLWLAGKSAPKVSMQVERNLANKDESPGIVAEVRTDSAATGRDSRGDDPARA